MPTLRVKICGITNPGDAEAAIEAGADALGFNGFPDSKRYIDLARESEWIARLPALVTRVAVLVNPDAAQARAIADLPGIDLLQFHGDEPPPFCNAFAPRGYIKALATRNRDTLESATAFETRTILLDAFVPGAYGGTGQLIDLPMAAGFIAAHRKLRVVLSGWLTPENVGDAIRATRPYAVDVASGVESHPRRKDPSLMREFILAAREAAAQNG